MTRTEKFLTQRELVIHLSLPAMEWILDRLSDGSSPTSLQVDGEIYNFQNLLQNLIERGVDIRPDPVIQSPATNNLDLI